MTRLEPRVAIVSDTVDDINGVALGLRRLVAAARRAGYSARLLGPDLAARADLAEVERVPSAMRATLPFYPQMTWGVPALPALVDALSGRVDLVQISTPGPMGIAGLIAARMLGVPVVAQYHTEVAEYAARMTGLPALRAVIEPLVGWLYAQADRCLAPSRAVVARLESLGIPGDRIAQIPRGVDLERFRPSRRDSAVRARLGGGPVVLYVGRLSAEKNLELLSRSWPAIRAAHPGATLAVVGEGPRAGSVTGDGVIATGPLRGDELAAVFASADVFAFPSQTETFGNVVVEAAASGLPAVVVGGGAASEHVVDGETGRVSAAEPGAFAAAVSGLLGDRARLASMSVAARARAERAYDLDRAVRATWALYRSAAAVSRRLAEVAS